MKYSRKRVAGAAEFELSLCMLRRVVATRHRQAKPSLTAQIASANLTNGLPADEPNLRAPARNSNTNSSCLHRYQLRGSGGKPHDQEPNPSGTKSLQYGAMLAVVMHIMRISNALAFAS